MNSIPPPVMKQSGAEMILAERIRQATVKGFDKEHDDRANKGGQLARAAICYTQPHNIYLVETFWPWDRSWFKPDTVIRCLVKAGALIAAEIDRLIRMEEQNVNTK